MLARHPRCPARAESNLRHSFLIPLLLCLLPLSAGADTASVYRDASGKVFQVRILDAASGTRTAYGSGFAVDNRGDIVTNFHVVADLIEKPEQFHIETLDQAGRKQAAVLVSFDAVNDLALIRVPQAASSYITLHDGPTEQGTRLYSIGLPLDQDFTISEGTYNGLLPDALTPRIHFTGPLNPGVSGGPAIDDKGQLVGVNVSTMGNSVGHLVPADKVAALLAAATSQPLDAARSSALLTQQLTRHQADYIGSIMTGTWPGVQLGAYRAPGQIAAWLKCWADSDHTPTNRYETTTYGCYPGHNEIYVSEHLQTAVITVRHKYVTAAALGTVRFAWLMSQQANGGWWGDFGGTHEEAGNFYCKDGYIRSGKLTLNTSLCTRALRKLPGLFDAGLQVVTVAGPGKGLVSQLKIQGASYENVLALSRKFVEQIAWKP
jgi:S1-C subfamily serine protease